MSAITGQILTGDALEVLRTLPDGLVDCVVTSPPYYALRDYGTRGQLGRESHVDDWVAGLRSVAAELRRVLAPHGALWLNLGDAYAQSHADGAPRKSLLMGPERVARALLSDGWVLRNKVVWAKSNPLPTSVRDRLNTTHEFVYFFVKAPTYFFDLDAIRVPARSTRKPTLSRARRLPVPGRLAGRRDGLDVLARAGRVAHPSGKNPGDVWQLGTSANRHGHPAPFPASLVRRPILATCPEAVCTACGKPWRRSARPAEPRSAVAHLRPLLPCSCGVPTRPGIVLDPFMGSGTVARVAEELNRDWLGIELNPTYAEQARMRILAARERAA